MTVQTTPLEVRLTNPHAFKVSTKGGTPVLEVDTLTLATKLSGRLLLNGVDIGALAHVPVTLGGGSDPALALAGQQLTLADVLTPAEHTAIGTAAPHHAAITLAADADTLLTLVGQLIGLDPQAANLVFVGPAVGIPADPTFRSLVDADIPAGVMRDAEHLALGAAAPHHAAVTLGGGSDPALALAGQQLTLADVLTPAEHTAIGAAAPHHATLHAAAQHNAAVLMAGANENLGAYYLDIDDIAVPANPAATIRRLFVNTVTGELSVRTAAGATVSLEAVGGVAAHNILDGAVHLDSALDGCSQGSLIVGIGSTPALWDELVIGGAGTYLRSDATDATWSAIQDADVPASHSGSAHHVAITLAADADVLLGLVGQQLQLDAQVANLVFAGPAVGGAVDPTFRALVDADIPGVHAGSAHHAQAHGPAQHTTGNAWNALYLDALGDEQEVALGALGTYYRSAGPAIAPTMSAIQDLDVPGVHTGTAHHAQAHAAAQHNAAALPAGFNENLGAFYLDIDDIAVPANPAATIRRLFVNQATGELSVRTSAGVTVSLEAGGGGGGVAAHNLLDGVVHLDTVLQGCSRGSLIYGNSGLNWDELVVGGAGGFLRADGVDVSWGAIIDGDVPGVHSGTAHHVKYTGGEAITAVEAADPLNLAGVVTLAKYLEFDEIAAPGAGGANKLRLFAKSGSWLAMQDDNGSVVPLEGILDRDLTTVDVVNTAVETSVYSHVIPANTLGATGGVELRVSGDFLAHGSMAFDRTLQVKVKLGATTVLDTGAVVVLKNNNRRNWVLDIWFLNSATNAQKWGGPGLTLSAIFAASQTMIFRSTGTAIIYLGAAVGTSAEDTTGALTLDVTVQHQVANAVLSFKKETAFLKLLPAA